MFENLAPETADELSDALLAAGALAVEFADADQNTEHEQPIFDEPGVRDASDALWPRILVVALFPDPCDATAALTQACDAMNLAASDVTVAPVADEDWVRITQAQFAPVQINERMWVVPTWHEPVDTGAINLRLDPGNAFGTGTHPTTRLCLGWLCDAIKASDTVIDYGCGSGVLAIAAKRLGAGEVIGIDIDPQAVETARRNAELNEAPCTFADTRTPLATMADVLVANILANPLCVLAPMLAARVKRGGSIALSGILEAQAGDVMNAYSPWFSMTIAAREDGWVLLAGLRQ